MNLLFVHEVNWSTKVTFEIHELPELLAIRGHRVDFIDYPEGVSRRGFRRFLDIKTETTEHRSRTYQGSKVRVITPGRIFAHACNRLFASLTFIPQLTLLLVKERYDAIILYSVPTNGWQTLLLSKLFRIPVIYRGLDVSHQIRKSSFRSLIRVAERFVYRHSTWLSLNNEELLNYCVDTGARRDRCSVDFAGVGGDWNVPQNRALELRSQLSITSERRIIYYLGSLFAFSGLPRVLDDLARNSRLRSMVSVVVTGDGELMDELTEMVKELNLQDCVRLVGRIQFDQVPVYLAIADVGIVPFEMGLVSHAAFPWKVVQYLAAGVPVVATQLKGLQSVFPEGVGVTYASPQRPLLERVEELLAERGLADAIARRGADFVDQNFRWEHNVSKFEDRFRSVIKLGQVGA